MTDITLFKRFILLYLKKLISLILHSNMNPQKYCTCCNLTLFFVIFKRMTCTYDTCTTQPMDYSVYNILSHTACGSTYICSAVMAPGDINIWLHALFQKDPYSSISHQETLLLPRWPLILSENPLFFSNITDYFIFHQKTPIGHNPSNTLSSSWLMRDHGAISYLPTAIHQS